MHEFIAELVATAVLILLGDGVVAAVLLHKSKAQNGGWMVITMGWGLGVAVAVYGASSISGAHLNPAVTLSQALVGDLPWGQVPIYLAGQFLGAFLGAVLVWLTYLPHFAGTDSQEAKLSVFATVPAIRNPRFNLLTEIIGTAMLVLGVAFVSSHKGAALGGLSPLLVGFVVVSIGLSLGGPTGYAINPARDLGPRIAHAVLPIPGKGESDWGYAWVPVVGPVIGAVIGAVLTKSLF